MMSDAKARKIKPDDKPVALGGVSGAFLFPSATAGQGKWILRFVSPVSGKRRDMGLGIYPAIGIAEARKAAFSARQEIAAGVDPIEKRKMLEAENHLHVEIPTFEQAALGVYEELRLGFRNPKHADQWINTLKTYVFPYLAKVPVSDLKARDFADALKPIWLKKPETAYRVRQRCDAIMKWCAAREFVMASPLGVVDALLPRQPGKRERVEHHPAVPWRLLPQVYQKLFMDRDITVGRLALEFLVLTACRSGEVRCATWNEFDFKQKIWQISGERMKTHRPHTVPLCSRALEILARMRDQHLSGSLVFPSRRLTPLSDATLTKILIDADIASDTPDRHATAHGFRSSFRDWASENGYPRDVAERALAHTISSATEAAYHRTDLLEVRRPLMNAWADFTVASSA